MLHIDGIWSINTSLCKTWPYPGFVVHALRCQTQLTEDCTAIFHTSATESESFIVCCWNRCTSSRKGQNSGLGRFHYDWGPGWLAHDQIEWRIPSQLRARQHWKPRSDQFSRRATLKDSPEHFVFVCTRVSDTYQEHMKGTPHARYVNPFPLGGLARRTI